jgi:hypothetical protein
VVDERLGSLLTRPELRAELDVYKDVGTPWIDLFAVD